MATTFLWIIIILYALSCVGRVFMLATVPYPRTFVRTRNGERVLLILDTFILVWLIVILNQG